MVVYDPAEIRTEHLTNTNPDHYSYTNHFGFLLQTEDSYRHMTRIYSYAKRKSLPSQ
jgi:hypothetical protein